MKKFKLLALLLVSMLSINVWGEDIILAEWNITSKPTSGTAIAKTGGTATGSTCTLTGTIGGIKTKNDVSVVYFTAISTIQISIKAPSAIAKGTIITVNYKASYNKDSNAPWKGVSITAKEGSSTAGTTGLNPSSFSFSTTVAQKTFTYTLQNDLAKDAILLFTMTQTGKVASGEGYFNNVSVTMPEATSSKTLTSLGVSGTLSKTQYYTGDSFDPTGLTVTGYYDDKSEENVTSQVVWTPNPLTLGTASVTGTLGGKNCVVNGITVEDPILVTLNKSNSPFTGTSASSTVYTKTLDDIEYQSTGGYIYNSTYLSLGKNTSYYLGNNTEFCGNIEKIVIDFNSGGTSHITMYQGTSALPSSNTISPDKTVTSGSATYTFNGNSPYFKLKIAATTNYVNINSIKIYLKPCIHITTAITLVHNNNGQGNGSVSFTTGNSTPDATPTWVVPKENTGWVLTGYYTVPADGAKVINANNTLNTGASTYVDSNGKWKYTETTLSLYAQWMTTACAKPTNLSQTDVTTTSAILTWDAVAGAASYTVTIIDAGSYINELTGLTTNSAFVNDLTSNTEYTWTVKAIGKEGYTDSEESSEKDFTTACSNPITITKGTPSNGSFDLSQIGTVCIDGGNATVSVTNITPATHYHFSQITATNGSVDNANKQVTDISADATINVEFTEDTKYTITFADNLQHTASIPNTTNNKIDVYSGETFNFPVIADRTAATSGTCEQVHYHFMGWVLSTHEGTIAAGDIKTGTSAAVTAAATYYAVWAKEEL